MGLLGGLFGGGNSDSSERPYVNIDNSEVQIARMERDGSRWRITVRTRASSSTSSFTIGRNTRGGNSSVNGEAFDYSVDWGN